MFTATGLRRLCTGALVTLLALTCIGVASAGAAPAAHLAARRATPTKTTPTKVIRSYQYAGTTNPDQSLTATFLTTRTNAPWIVVIHGGSWINGSQANMTKSVNLFYAHGWQVFNLSYRLKGATYSQQVSDVQTAARWIVAHASAFHSNAERGAVYGFSAGGELAAVLGMTGPFRAIVSASGVLQPQRVGEDVDGLRATTEPATPSMISLYTREQQMMGCALSDDMSPACVLAWYTFEPEHLIKPSSPPMLIFQGAADPVVPPATATTFGSLLTVAHVHNIVDIVAGYGHDDAEVFASTIRTKLMLNFVATATALPPTRRATPRPAR